MMPSRAFRTGALVRRAVGVTAVVGLVATATVVLRAQRPVPDVHVWPVQGNIYMIVGAGGNITVQVGDDGVLVVDAGAAPLSEAVLGAIRTLSPKTIRYIVDTSADPDHVGGNEYIAKAGRVFDSGNTRPLGAAGAASIMAHVKVLDRMSAPTGKAAPTPTGAWPTDTYFTENLELFFNGEAIQILSQPAAHTDGDSIVYFRHSDVISAGDVFLTTGYPVFDAQRGGTIQGVIDALNRIIDLAIPARNEEDGTLIVPGHGRLCDEADIVEYRDMVTIIQGRIADLVKKGRTLEQVKASRPTFDYDGRYGSNQGPWTTEMFIEAIFRELGGK